MNETQVKDILQEACINSVNEFLSTSGDAKLVDKSISYGLDEVYGPSIECFGDNVKYIFTLRYELEQNQDYLNLFLSKYTFVDKNELPSLDLNDFLGEFLNIMSGKVNKSFEALDPKLQPKAPYFTQGFESIDEQSEVNSFSCEFDGLNFTLFYQVLA